MKFWKLLTLSIALNGIVLGCEDENDSPKKPSSASVKLQTTMSAKGTQYQIGDTLQLANGANFKVTQFKLLVSNVYLIDAQGNETLVKDVSLNYVGNDTSGSFTADVDPGSYEQIRFGLGINPQQNSQQPEDFPRDHPLSSYSQMYWSMLNYRFAVMEGKADMDSPIGGTDDVSVSYHPGTNELYKKVTLPLSIDLQKNAPQQIIRLNIDLNTLFDGANGNPSIDIINENETVVQKNDPVATKFMTNLKSAISVHKNPILFPLL